MVHEILQFTPSITFRNVLHLCESRDIRCRESFSFKEEAQVPPTHAVDGERGAGYRFKYSLALSAPGLTIHIAPPTKNGHAPPPIESRNSSQSVNPYYVWTWYAAQETDFEQAYDALAPRLRWQAGQDVAARAGIQPDRTCRIQLTRRASKCSVDARPAPAPAPGKRCRALLPMRTLQGLKQVPLDTIARPVGGAEEMKARSAHARAPATTAAGARQRIGLGRMRAAPGARPEGSIQDLPLAR
ncbi:hypothetical protein CQW23_35227 [Capsicum baccatum]|uniref:Uncharacterized protein n=1 Tax=Capsicum baccatum TaxID=33114 RepID=A0A2G2UWP9_CAPBA|nr:hypothetical protein CQW23_35227 [Capsicum baccatum]